MRKPPKNLAIKIDEDLDYVYWKVKENEIHAEPLTKQNRDEWIKLAAENNDWR